MSITGEAEGEPMKIGVALVDVLTGVFAASATLGALFGRERTGEGQRVDLSLFESALAGLVNVGSNYLVSGDAPRRYGNAHPNIVPYQLFRTSDGYLALGVGNDRQYARFCEVAGVPELAAGPYTTNRGRSEHRSPLLEALRPVFARRGTDEWLALLDAEGIPCGVVQGVGRAFESEQAAARDMVWVIEHPSAGKVRLAGLPYKFSGTPLTIYRHPPLLGEHTDEVLRELGRTDAEIAGLREAGVV